MLQNGFQPGPVIYPRSCEKKKKRPFLLSFVGSPFPAFCCLPTSHTPNKRSHQHRARPPPRPFPRPPGWGRIKRVRIPLLERDERERERRALAGDLDGKPALPSPQAGTHTPMVRVWGACLKVFAGLVQGSRQQRAWGNPVYNAINSRCAVSRTRLLIE